MLTYSPRTSALTRRKKSRPFRPTQKTASGRPSFSRMNSSAFLRRFVLNAPQRPLSDVMSSSPRTPEARGFSSGCVSSSAESTRSLFTSATDSRMSESSSCMRSANGRAPRMRAWARRRRAAATIFMALVICCVDFTLLTFLLSSRSDGINLFDDLPDCLGLQRVAGIAFHAVGLLVRGELALDRQPVPGVREVYVPLARELLGVEVDAQVAERLLRPVEHREEGALLVHLAGQDRLDRHLASRIVERVGQQYRHGQLAVGAARRRS